MNAADSSCLTCMNRMASCRCLSASIMPLMPSPGSPKITFTPQSTSRSTSNSAAVRAIHLPPKKLFDTQVWYLYRSFRGGQFMYCELQRPKDGKEDHYDNEQYRRHRQSDSDVVAKLVTTWTHNEDI